MIAVRLCRVVEKMSLTINLTNPATITADAA